MTRLNQILAIEKGAKARGQRAITDAYHDLQKPALLEGIARSYQPVDEDGERFPSESKRVQLRVGKVLDRVKAELVTLFDVVATKDTANKAAVADVSVDGTNLLTGVPVTYLLFLEKALGDLVTFIASLPTLDPTKEWVFDEVEGVNATPVVETAKTKKIPKNHVRAAATDKHPAQVDVYHEDVVVGYWSTKLYSGALPPTRVEELLTRVRKLQDAVKKAREEANSIEIQEVHYGDKILGYILA